MNTEKKHALQLMFILAGGIISILLGMCGKSHAQLTIKDAQGRVPSLITVKGFGQFEVSSDGTIDLISKLEERLKQVGRGESLPRQLEVFVEPFEGSAVGQQSMKMSALLATVDLSLLKGNATLTLKPAAAPKDATVAHFVGPTVTDEQGNLLAGVNVYALGQSESDVTDQTGQVMSSFLVNKEAKEISLILLAPGYELETVKLPIPRGLAVDKSIEVRRTIKLKPAANQVINFIPLTTNLQIRKEKATFAEGYYRLPGDTYFYQFILSDGVKKQTYSWWYPLKSTVLIKLSAELKNGIQVTNGLRVATSDLPADLPRIVVNLDRIQYSTGDQSSGQVGMTEEKQSAGFVFVKRFGSAILMGVLLAVTFIVLLELVHRKSEIMKLEDKHKKELMVQTIVAVVGSVKKETIWNGMRLQDDPKLEPAMRQLIESTLAKVYELTVDITEKKVHALELRATIKKHQNSRRGWLQEMRTCIDSSSFDLATKYRSMIEESEKQEAALESTLTDLNTVVGQRTESLQELIKALGELCERGERLKRQADAQVDLNGIQEQIMGIMAGLKSSFGKESQTVLDPSNIETLIRERRKARNTGLTLDEVESMKEFVATRNS